MAELHIVVQLDDTDVQNFARAVEDLTEVYAVQHWGAHVHAQPEGEIVGWQVTDTPQIRTFFSHSHAEAYARRTGGTLSPIFAEEAEHAAV